MLTLGSWMLVSSESSDISEAFEIDRVETREGKTWILLKDDPGWEKSGSSTTETCFPRRSFTGELPFTIYTQASSCLLS